MNDEEIRALYDKFPCVLKKALQEGVVNFDTYEPQKNYEPKVLYRGLRGKKTSGDIELFNSDFLSQAELLDWAEKIESAENEDVVKSTMPEDLILQVDLFRNNPKRRGIAQKDNLGDYSCSFSDSYEKLEGLYAKPWLGKYIAKGCIDESCGVISDKHGKPGHIHCFLYEGVGLKGLFEVCK